ncbi:MAG: Archaeal Lon protease [Methanomassiliicoccales archaeon PtaB.Bin134]|nr:MAG: Archaeal Lon protease [Methanomassiliicoccales archaeon PtaB.Bin134]
MIPELTYDQARKAMDEKAFTCDSTEEIKPLETILGQERALRALNLGLRIKDKGFNIFISGIQGTGRKSAIQDFSTALAVKQPVPPDWCYVNNFVDSSRPRAISLAAGQGASFKKAMERLVTQIPPALREAFESAEYAKQREAVVQKINQERNEIVANINALAKEAGFLLQPSPVGIALTPIVEGRPLTEADFQQLPPALQKKINEEREALNSKMGEMFRPLQETMRKVDKELLDLNRRVAAFAVAPYIGGVRDEFHDNHEVIEYLEEVQNDIVDNVPLFLSTQPKEQNTPAIDPTRNYRVNLIVDNSRTVGAPVLSEFNPTYVRLFGYSEREARFGALVTDYTMIRAGTAHLANGGYLIIPVERMFQDPMVWEGLKQTISTGKLELEDPVSRMGYMVTKTLRPEPIPFDAKIVLIGNPQVYNILYNLDPDFKELFKVKADFDTEMDRTPENIELYTSFMCSLVTKEGLLHLDPSALAAVVEHASRMADDQGKMTTQFARVADIIREASFYAQEEGSKTISRKHILKQLEEREYRSNLIQKKIEESVTKGLYLIDITGAKVGQINGLAVFSVGDYAFGRPSRITATVGIGREGIVDIERLSQMGGATHTKGVLILSGFLHERYARTVPLSLSARLVFEQSYSGVDGDSASSTELYAILSALSGVPIRQNIAVTGSVNQKGEVQAIGGVNQKVEGFYETCKALGLTGDQGCMIPHSNVQNLMLKEEVVQAIKDGKFHIWPVRTIDEGIEVLTSRPAGALKEDGTFEEGTINDLVQKRLQEMAEAVKAYHP